MYRWTESVSENYAKKCSRKSSVEGSGNMSLKSGSRKELVDFYNGDPDDVEAQISRYPRREARKTSDSKDDYYYHQNTLERKSRQQRESDELTTAESRISDVRENWRLRVMRESESKQSKPVVERKKNGQREEAADDDVWEVPTVRQNWNAVTESLKKELHRSKSTPDMLSGSRGKAKLEIWPGEEEPKRNGSMMDMYTRSWGGE